MPDFWEFPTVSMGLGPIMAIYQARFNQYLQRPRHSKTTSGPQGLGLPRRRRMRRAGDARRDHARRAREARQPDLRHQLQPAAARRPGARQRQDHPGAGRAVPRRRLERDQGHLGRRLGSAAGEGRIGPARQADGRSRRRPVSEVHRRCPAAYIREHFFGKYPELSKLVENYSDEKLAKLRRGGHDPEKVYAAYKAAVERKGQPTVILAKTIKGYGLGEAGEGRNIAHNKKKLNEEELLEFRTRFGIPISDERSGRRRRSTSRRRIAPEMKYLRERRAGAGRSVPSRPTVLRRSRRRRLEPMFKEFTSGSQAARKMSTTMALRAACSRKLLPRQADRQVRRADRARRIADVRHGRHVRRDRHLLARRPALRAGRFGHSRQLQGSDERPDSGRGHHRSRLDVAASSRRARPTARTAST